MHIIGMDQAIAIARSGLTVRLPRDIKDRVQLIAAAEHRSVAGYIEMLIERDLHARDEADRVVYVFVAPELEGKPFSGVVQEPDEDDESYARRSEALAFLLGGRKAAPD